MAFLRQFAGAPICLAATPKGRGAIERLAGAELARELAVSCAHLFRKRAPLAQRWLAQALKVQGHSTAQIVRTRRATGVSVSVSGW